MTQGLEVSSRSFSEIMAYMHGNILEIPPYQREYDWELEHVSLLIRDIYEHYSIWKDLDTSKKRHKQAGTIIILPLQILVF